MSEETNAFSAKFYVNGILTADCSDTGKGGCIDIRVIRGKEALLSAAESYVKSLPAVKTEFGFELEMDLELFLGQLVESDIVEKEFKKSVKQLEADNIVFGKSKTRLQYTWFTAKGNNKKVSIAAMLSAPSARKMLTGRIKKLKEEGYLIFNTNIPAELPDGDTPES